MMSVLRSAICLIILYILSVYAYNTCKVPNAGLGTCIRISKCTPLQVLYKKPHKTRLENLFIQQSVCGNSDSPALKVCCPLEEEWSSFKPRPVVFPGSDNTVYNVKPTEATPKPTQSVDIIRPNLAYIEGFGTRVGQNKKLTCGLDSASSNKITGGTIVTGIDQYPWLALLEYRSTTEENIDACGGSLINSRFVLTAAHCVPGSFGNPIYVRLAEYNKTTSPTDEVDTDGGGKDYITERRIEVESTFRYPRYNRLEMLHDIGIVKMVADVEFDDFVKAICLPTVNFLPSFNKNTTFTVAGWGTDNDVNILVKSQVRLPYVGQCNSEDEQVNRYQICAGGEAGKDSCRGDSGGPLMYEYNQHFYAVGVVSNGPTVCGTPGQPGVYTNVYEYLSWIDSVISQK